MKGTENETTPLPGAAPMRTRQGLPLQNLALAAVIIGVVAGAAHLLNVTTHFPFGHCEFARFAGPRWLGGFLIWSPLVWIVALLSARGTARLLLSPKRQLRHYGYWLLVVTAALGTVTQAALDLFGTQVMEAWSRASAGWSWEGIALPNLAGSFGVSVIALLLATPALIDKRPVPSLPGLIPLSVWFALNVVCIAVCLSRASDAAIAVLATLVLAVTMLAYQRHRLAVTGCGKPSGWG